jgi:hypothetical protein
MPQSIAQSAGTRVIQVIEDDRSAVEIFQALVAGGRITHSHYDDIHEMALRDTYTAQPGKSHLLRVFRCEAVHDDRDSSFAKLLAIGVEAGLERYSMAVALKAIELNQLPKLGAFQMVFAHAPIYLPRQENLEKGRQFALGLRFSGDGGVHRAIAVRIKRGRPIGGTQSIVFGQP